MNGLVVRGVAGRRNEYRPVQSRLAADPSPLGVARAFRDQLGLSRFYLADLDGIQHGRPRFDIHQSLAEEGFELLVDAGLRDVAGAGELFEAGAAAVIAGLETSDGPEHVRHLCTLFGTERIVFSLDLLNRRLLNPAEGWRSDDPYEVAQIAIDAGVRNMIVLDLAGVGTGGGVPTAALCERLKLEFPELRLITGGGVRGIDDLQALGKIGVDGVLLASALHAGTLGRAEIQSL